MSIFTTTWLRCCSFGSPTLKTRPGMHSAKLEGMRSPIELGTRSVGPTRLAAHRRPTSACVLCEGLGLRAPREGLFSRACEPDSMVDYQAPCNHKNKTTTKTMIYDCYFVYCSTPTFVLRFQDDDVDYDSRAA